jgi:hypothetical protein
MKEMIKMMRQIEKLTKDTNPLYKFAIETHQEACSNFDNMVLDDNLSDKQKLKMISEQHLQLIDDFWKLYEMKGDL